MKGKDTKGDLLARALANTQNKGSLHRLLNQVNDFKQQKILLAAYFEHMNVIEKLAFLADCDIPEVWRQKHVDELVESEDSG